MKRESLIAVLAVLAVALSCAVVMAEDAEARTSEKAIIDVEPLFADEEDDMFSDPTTVSDGAYYYS